MRNHSQKRGGIAWLPLLAFWSFRYSCFALICLLAITFFRILLNISQPTELTVNRTEMDCRDARHQMSCGPLRILAEPTLTAGEPTTITVITESVMPLSLNQSMLMPPVQLSLLMTTGTLLLEAPRINGVAQFQLNGSITQSAGTMTLIAQSADQRVETTMTIVPGPPVEPLLALVGPRSITADGKHWTMLTALPNDEFGNAVVTGTPVTVRTQHPATVLTTSAATTETLETITTTTEYLLAWARIFSRTKTGRITIAATAGNAHSPERTVLAVPGSPQPFTIHAEPAALTADGRQFITVITETLVDQYTNPLLDGTVVTFVVTNTDGTERRLPAQVIDGRATVQVQAPIVTGTLHIKALVLDTTSESLTLNFTAGLAIAPFDLEINQDEEVITFIAGPLLGPLRQYIPDGSEVIFSIQATTADLNATPPTSAAEQQRIMASAKAGFASAAIRRTMLPAGRYRIAISLGSEEQIFLMEIR